MTSYQRMNLAFDEYHPESEDGTIPTRCPLVLLHGMMASKESWKDCAQLIADRTCRKVVAFDARNHGDSDCTETFDYGAMVDDVGHFLDSRGVDRALVVGHSMGSKVAMMFALKHPDRVEKLVIEDTGFCLSEEMHTKVVKVFRAAKESEDRVLTGVTDLEEARLSVKSFLRQAVTTKQESQRSIQDGNPDKHYPPLKMTETGRFVWKGDLHPILNFVESGGLKTRPDHGLYSGPVLFVICSQSPFKVLDEKDYLLGMFPRAEFELISGKTHLLHIFHRDEFCDKVVHFINKTHRSIL